jgi:hypothetical protein
MTFLKDWLCHRNCKLSYMSIRYFTSNEKLPFVYRQGQSFSLILGINPDIHIKLTSGSAVPEKFRINSVYLPKF